MAWIEMIAPENATRRLKTEYERLGGPEGEIDNILQIHSLNPASLRGHFDLYRTLMRGRSPLTKTQREMIAVTVSAANACHY